VRRLLLESSAALASSGNSVAAGSVTRAHPTLAPAGFLRQPRRAGRSVAPASRLNHCGAIFGCTSPLAFRVRRRSPRAGTVSAGGGLWGVVLAGPPAPKAAPPNRSFKPNPL